MDSILVEQREHITIITINRPLKKNSIDRPTAQELTKAFLNFDADPRAWVAILTGVGGTFCAGADLSSFGDLERRNEISFNVDQPAPLGPSRLRLSKPVIAAISGYAVAGGFELACWCDLRIIDDTSIFGIYCRSKGVPLIDGGTVRLPKLIGRSLASDLILTGRSVLPDEAMRVNLANYRAAPGHTALEKALEVALALNKLPQACLRADLESLKRVHDDEFGLALEVQIGSKSFLSDDWLVKSKKFINKSKL